jgi:hypothetical protein
MDKQKIDLRGFNYHQYTNRNGLKGIYSKNTGELPCQARTLIAVDENDDIIAKVTYSTYGNEYVYKQRDFGNQLEEALGDRFGY